MSSGADLDQRRHVVETHLNRRMVEDESYRPEEWPGTRCPPHWGDQCSYGATAAASQA